MATTTGGMTATGLARLTRARVGLGRVMTGNASLKATGTAIAANSGTTTAGIATMTGAIMTGTIGTTGTIATITTGAN